MRTKDEYICLLRQYKSQMSEKYGIRRMGIFGSVARGEQQEDSDLDVYVDITVPDAFTMLHIKYDLEDLLGCRIDIVRLRDNMNSILKRNIEKDGIYV